MTGFTLPIQTQLGIVEELIGRAEKTIRNAPEGILVIGNKGTSAEWYLKKGRTRTYLSKTQRPLAHALAQAAYARDFLKKAEEVREELKQLKALKAERSASHMYHALAEPYEKLSEPRKQLVEAYVLPDEEFARAWEQETYEGKSFASDTPEIFTEKGERVRSKSEKMIADKLFRMGIHYRYESQLVLKGIGRFYPDFTLLDLMERVPVFQEHFGLMDDPDYRKSTFWKIDQYEKRGYPLGVRFLCSFESADYPLNLAAVENMLRARFGQLND